MSMPTPRKRLPVNPSIEHLKKQAKRRTKADSSLSLSDAQHALAREYGCRNWGELAHVVETMSRGSTQTMNVKQEFEALPAAANRNELEEVQRILREEDFTQHDLDLALGRAVLRFNERRAIAELLIEHGADPNGQYGSNYGPIIFAPCETLDFHGIQFLIDHGADVTFMPIETKYGNQCPIAAVLGTYVRGRNSLRYWCFAILRKHGAYVPEYLRPEFLDVLLGDAKELAEMIHRDPAMVQRRYPDMPFGNIALRGATLLHMAVDYGEIECVDVLLANGAQINARAEVIDGVGGQTPIYHAIASPQPDWDIRMLDHLVNDCDRWIEMSVKATFQRYGQKHTMAVTPIEFAREEAKGRETAELKLLERMARPKIGDAVFEAAVEAMDAGDVKRLRELLRINPELVTARAGESGSFAGPYFKNPRLLWFVAENPTRTGRMAENVVEIAEAIIDAGALREDITYTAELVASGCVAREQKKQIPLLEMLIRRGADGSAALATAVQEREREAIKTLLRLGVKPNLAAAAGLGDLEALKENLKQPFDQKMKESAWYNMAINGRPGAAEVLVREAGFDVNMKVGLGVTALHLAGFNGHQALVERLLKLGGDPTIRDGRWNATASGWAAHAGHEKIARRLREVEQEQIVDGS